MLNFTLRRLELKCKFVTPKTRNFKGNIKIAQGGGGGGSLLPSSNQLFSPTKIKVNQVASDIIKPNTKESTKNPLSYRI